MSSPLEEIRSHYANLITGLAASGRKDEAHECAQLAVKQGIWKHPSQRPLHFVPSLPAVPCYDRRRFWVTKYLEDHYREIRAEIDGVKDAVTSGFSPVEEPLVGAGRWDQVVFYEGGQRFDQAHDLFPVTSSVIEGLPEEARAAGVIMLSWLHPNSHIVPHCGHTNARLRIHLAIKSSPDAFIRVHDKFLNWTEGECLVFDDSFEHEAWHMGQEPRVVLLFDIFNPALPQAEKTAQLERAQSSAKERARQLMKERGFRRITRSADEKMQLELDEGTELLLRRYMREGRIQSVEVKPDGEVEIGFEPSRVKEYAK
jgi:aspartyl/asparaginyl beta-hydroxylase (cupin superfamily)